MKILELLRTRVAERRGTAAEMLAAAANRVAAGETVDPDTIDRAMVDAGVDVDAFEAMCDLARRRMAWRSTIDRQPAAEARLLKTQTAIDKEKAAFEDTVAAWRKRGAELDAEVASATAVITAARDARAELVRPVNVPEPLRHRLADAIAESEAAMERVAEINRELRSVRQTEKDQIEWATHKGTYNISTPGGDSSDHQQRAKRAARRAAELLEELKTAQAVADKLAATVRDLETAALKA